MNKEIRIRNRIRIFLENFANNIKDLKFNDLNPNPFLISFLSSPLGLDSPKELMNWCINQRIERSAVTSFGIAIQEIAQVFMQYSEIPGVDGSLEKSGTRYFVKMASGPLNLSVRGAQSIAVSLNSACTDEPDSRAIFGICYGTWNKVNSPIKKHIGKEENITVMVGREFWDFIAGKEWTNRILRIGEDESRTFRTANGESLRDIFAKKEEMVTQFGGGLNEQGENWLSSLI